ncbi:MAG TPA: tetratricopeptide repeat protein [Mycobacteriales bacterium]|nr:tetratricopeptide repeat protein [Mycobacteriales bacterium]
MSAGQAAVPAGPAGPAGGAFGSALRRARAERGLSLAGLARLVHYSRGYLSKVETGMSQPNDMLARRCDDALGTGGELSRLVPPRRARSVPAADPTRPFDLPAAPGHFTGRAAELALIRRLLVGSGRPAGSVPVVLLHGMGGVGKTALAVLAGHRLDADFPGGCLFVGLHSYAPDRSAVPAADALDTLLRRLGVPGRVIPAHVEERAALYHSVLHDRRVLVVVDDARRADQVRPLIPAGAGCALLVTSRRRLTALDDAYPIRLDPLPLAEATALFRAVAGLAPADQADQADPTGSVDATDEHVEDVVRCCGQLPLTVRIAAAGQRGDAADLAGLARRLDDSRTRLAELDDGERSATAVLATSCAGLPAPRRRLLALLTLAPGARIPAEAAGWLSDTAPGACQRELRGLAEDNLLLAAGGAAYQLHDLTRAYAAEVLLAGLPGPDRDSALRRLVTGYLAAAVRADEQLTPHRHRPPVEPYPGAAPPGPFPDADAAGEWARAEQDTLVAVCRLAAARGWDTACWQLAYMLRGYFFLAKARDAWLDTHRHALAAAERTGDDWAIAATRNNLGLALIERGQIHAAGEQHSRALPIFRRLGDGYGEAATLGHQAWAGYCTGSDVVAVRLGKQALALYERQDAGRGIGITLRTIAMAQTRLRRFAEADRDLRRALALFTELHLPLDAAMTLNNLGGLHAQLGRAPEAVRWFGQAIERAASCGSGYEQARAYDGLAETAAILGRPRAARRFADRSRARYDALHVPAAERHRINPIAGLDPAVPRSD